MNNLWMYPQRIGEVVKEYEETKTREYTDKHVGKMLIKNGFINKSKYFYLTEKCSVEIGVEGYCVSTEKDMMFSDVYDIYWLIGVLTYRGLMDKNYKQ